MRALSSVVERLLHTQEAIGSIPIAPTRWLEIVEIVLAFWRETPYKASSTSVVCSTKVVSAGHSGLTLR